MALTVNDIALNLDYAEGDYVEQELQDLLDDCTQIVKDHVKSKFNAENRAQQRAIKMLCGYYDDSKNVEKEMQKNGHFLPEPVLAVLSRYYIPLCI